MSDNNTQELVYSEYLTTHEVSRLLGVNLRTIERWCKAGTMPAIKVGRRYRINRKHLSQWIQESSTGWIVKDYRIDFKENKIKHLGDEMKSD